ncbi:MAG: hypothetical protein FWF21_11575, partial [Micrococcales bacterium]|nr:hypothetical protein [Micrococcales bacterium]
MAERPADDLSVASPDTQQTAAARVRSRLARFGGRSTVAFPAIEPVLAAVRDNHPKADIAVIEQAFVVAERAHRSQLRK